MLVNWGADVVAGGCLSAPLHLFRQLGYQTVARLLIDRGADVHAGNQNGETPLRLASGRGHIAMVALLLDHGATVSATAPSGTTPLYMASEVGSEPVVRLLADRWRTSLPPTYPAALHCT
ncbi:ankyrin repeat protein [Tricharina praecox]|uniref:ankyrin repeat protein n=1 Tax=Tricharina praecox TaxID=43433 RepID=UPI00221FFA25|nr:ankyrin repeat protein [Tricharina praecox]KAI5856227.1 ankyrin repeat protein [Tricharina praecox]